MKLAIFSMVAIGCLIAVVSSAEEDYDYEEEPGAPITPAPTKSTRLGGLLSTRGRVNVGRKPAAAAAAAAQSTTAKAIEQPAEAEEEGEEELDENLEQQEEVLTTTTEASKKVRGGVRPFRSNQDLLAALKRRRSQVGSSSHRESTQTAAESTTAKSKASTNGRNKSTSVGDTKSSSGRGRFGGRGNKPVQEEVEETQREEVQVKPKPYRRG